LSTYRLYDSLQVLKKFRVLEEYNFNGYEKYFKEKFEFDLTALPEIDRLINFNISYRKLFRLGDSGIFKNIKRTHAMKENMKKIKSNLKKMGEAKKADSEIIKNSKGKDLIKNYIQGKAMTFKHDKVSLFNILRHFNGILQTKHLGYTFKNQ